jgi:hypothetical protein
MTTTVTMTGPGSTTIVNDAAAAITAQTIALSAELVFIDGAIVQINNNIAKILEQSILQSKALSEISIALAGVSSATSNQTVLQAAATANQIKTFNFQVEATKAALIRTGQPVPVMPPITQQLEETISEATILQGAAVAQGAITNFISQQAVSTQAWIVGTEVYKTTAEYIKKAKNSLVSLITPPSASTIASAVAAATGDKTLK